MAYTGEIRIFAGNFAPAGWLACDGSSVPVASYPALAVLLKPVFGGDSQNFKLPDLRGRAPLHVSSALPLGSTGGSETAQILTNGMPAHTHTVVATDSSARSRSGQADTFAESQSRIYSSQATGQMSSFAVSSVGKGQPHENMQPSLAMMFIICASGSGPTGQDDEFTGNGFLAEIKLFAGNFAPKNFAKCEGQLLSLSQNTALFSLVGTMYGGDGRSTFALPDLRGSVPIGAGTGSGLTQRFIGDDVGSSAVSLTTDQLPPHSHPLAAAAVPGTTNDPSGNVLAMPFNGGNLYAPSGVQDPSLTALAPSSLTGLGIPHNNMQPYLGLTFLITLQGIFPPRPF